MVQAFVFVEPYHQQAGRPACRCSQAGTKPKKREESKEIWHVQRVPARTDFMQRPCCRVSVEYVEGIVACYAQRMKSFYDVISVVYTKVMILQIIAL